MAERNRLAERIARLLDESDQKGSELASVFASIEKINHRLERLESSLDLQSAFQGRGPIHPSQQKFTVLEASADQLIDGQTQQKACTFEPNGRPCDHCSMCSSRGF